ncbi:thioredoxin family protein [Puniceicoccaceae bacterium K14]|nr:thioredoxin family protein [Puniceicoccaceae bacterium K14]
MTIPRILFYCVALYLGQVTAEAKWFDNYNSAQQKALDENKLILLFFTGSDWCHWCHKLKREVFAQKDFETEIEEIVIPTKIDFPQRKKLSPKLLRKNQTLKAKFEVTSFPTVILYDPFSGKELWRHGYFETTPEDYIRLLELLHQSKHSTRAH